jgi:hypothetical protein
MVIVIEIVHRDFLVSICRSEVALVGCLEGHALTHLHIYK